MAPLFFRPLSRLRREPVKRFAQQNLGAKADSFRLRKSNQAGAPAQSAAWGTAVLSGDRVVIGVAE